MIEVENANSIIAYYSKVYKRKVYRFPFSVSENKELALLMVKMSNKYVSLPYFSQGIIERNPKNFDFNCLPKNWEIRDTKPHSQIVFDKKVNFEIPLNDYIFPPQIKRKINKAYKNGLTLKQGRGIQLVNDFYRVYSARMNEIGIPSVSKAHIIREVEEGFCILFIAYKKDKPIGVATLIEISKDYFENSLFATISSFHYLYTSYFLHNAMISYSKNLNASTYSLGRTNLNSSVYFYKKHWKAKEQTLYWSFNKKSVSFRNLKPFLSLWRYLPPYLKLLVGGIIHKKTY